MKKQDYHKKTKNLKLIPTHYHKKVDGKIIVKKTYWYLIEFIGDEKTQLIPDLNENITDCSGSLW